MEPAGKVEEVELALQRAARRTGWHKKENLESPFSSLLFGTATLSGNCQSAQKFVCGKERWGREREKRRNFFLLLLWSWWLFEACYKSGLQLQKSPTKGGWLGGCTRADRERFWKAMMLPELEASYPEEAEKEEVRLEERIGKRERD